MILQQSKSRYEDFHKVTYSEEVLEMCVNLADRYITDREFPDKAFDILDEVGARSQVEVKVPESIEILKQKALELRNQKLQVVKQQNYEQHINWYVRTKQEKPLIILVETGNESQVKFVEKTGEQTKSY